MPTVEVFFGCWGFLILLKLASDVFDWNSHGVIHLLIAGFLLAGYVLAGIPWLVLALGDGFRNRRLVWTEARPWLVVLIAALAVVFAVFVVQSAGS